MPSSSKMPVTAMLVAIVNLVLFVPCLCCSVVGVVGQGTGMASGEAFAMDAKQKEQIKKTEAALDAKLPNRKMYAIATAGAQVVGSMIMVIAAIGLLMKKPWGRLACLVGAVLMIVISLAGVASAVATLPPTIEIQEQVAKENPVPGAPPPGTMAPIMYGSVAIGALFTIGYPLLALILMMTGSVREFYSSAAALRSEEGGGRDDRDDDDRRDDDYNR